jgi:hypothetical protein
MATAASHDTSRVANRWLTGAGSVLLAQCSWLSAPGSVLPAHAGSVAEPRTRSAIMCHLALAEGCARMRLSSSASPW